MDESEMAGLELVVAKNREAFCFFILTTLAILNAILEVEVDIDHKMHTSSDIITKPRPN